MNNRFISFFIIILFICSCCSKVKATPDLPEPLENWKFSDILMLDPPNNKNPENDLLAVYFRHSPDKMQFRLDYLDILPDNKPAFELILEFTITPAYARENGILSLREKYHIRCMNGLEPEILADDLSHVSIDGLSIYWKDQLDYVVIGIDNQKFSSSHSLKTLNIAILQGDNQTIEYKSRAANNQILNSNNRASLILEFWDLMPGYTPAQALRRWDGAHTGPYGQRHGLRYLLEAIEYSKVPVILLDLKKPNSLSAIDYLGKMGKITDLEEQGLLILPDIAYGDPESTEQSLELTGAISKAFNLHSEIMVKAPFNVESEIDPQYRAAFSVLPDDDIMYRWKGLRLIPLPEIYLSPESGSPEIARDGLTIEAKRKLIEAAISGNKNQINVFGGSLPNSAWGDAQSSRLAMEYIQSHPWISVLLKEDIISFPVAEMYSPTNCNDLLCTPTEKEVWPYTATGELNSSSPSYTEMKKIIRKEIFNLPDDKITDLLWLSYLNLTEPANDNERIQLQANYLGNLGHLIAGINWGFNPEAKATCSVDLDWDGDNECILTSKQVFTSYETNGARLIVMISKGNQGLEQWFSPLSQLAIGLSDPVDWNLPQGPASDPMEIPGAFSEVENTYQPFMNEITDGIITFKSIAEQTVKLFKIQNNHLFVRYSSQSIMSTRIPLLDFASTRFTPQWIECLNINCVPHPEFFSTASDQKQQSFLDSYSMMELPENPSYGYPPGHYLPFPINLISISGVGDFSINFTFPP